MASVVQIDRLPSARAMAQKKSGRGGLAPASCQLMKGPFSDEGVK
jgi:hypothetical protein